MRFHVGCTSFSPFSLSAPLPGRPPPPHPPARPPTEGKDAPNHQSAISHRRQERRHAKLSVSPDRTAVPSGYPHTSNLTPMIFTRCAENWKKNTQEFKVSQVKVWTFSHQFVFYPLWIFFFRPPPTHSFLSMSNHCPLQPPLFGGSRRENVVLMLSGDQSSVKQEAENDNVLFRKTKGEVWAKIGFCPRWWAASDAWSQQSQEKHTRTFAQTSWSQGGKKKKVGKVFELSCVEEQLICQTHTTTTLRVIPGQNKG